MEQDRWQQLLESITEKFPDAQVTEGVLNGRPGTYVEVTYSNPQGYFKLVKTTAAKPSNEHALGANRPGAGVRVEKTYNTQEMVTWIELYKQDADTSEWVKVDFS